MLRKKVVFAVAAIILGGSAYSHATEQGDPVLEAYAAAYDLTYEQARDRLKMIDGAALEEIENTLKQEPGYAGMRLIHKPELRLEILGRGSASALAAKIATPIPVVSTDVPLSLAELNASARSASNALKLKNVVHMYDFDLKNGVIDLYLESSSIGSRSVADLSPKAAGVRVHVVESILDNTATFVGGQRVVGNEACTSGFTVVNSAAPSQRGVITAGHCTLTNTQRKLPRQADISKVEPSAV